MTKSTIAPRITSFVLTLAAFALSSCGDEEVSVPEQLRALDQGLLLHWTFEDRDGTTIFDVSGNGRNGALIGGGSFIESPYGEALSLDGVDDYLSFAGPRSPDLYGGVNGSFTISAHVRVADVLRYNTLCYGCGPFNTAFVGTPNLGARAVAGVFNQATNGVTWPLSSAALLADEWVEVTMIVEGGVGTRIYFGCELDSEIANADVGLKDYGSSTVGRGATADRWFAGDIDELRIWDRALTTEELPLVCEPSIARGLELHWTFEDRSGDTILDLSGNNRNGTLLGGGAFVASDNGEAVSLDGVDDYISFAGPRDPALYGGVNGSFTLSSRVRVANANKDNTLCFGCGPLNSMYIGTAAYSTRAMAAVFNQATNGVLWPLSNPGLVNDNWAEVTMVVEGGVGVRYYLDCNLDAEIANANVGLRDYGSSTVGRGSNASRWFGGEIDELRIWDRALNQTEIAALCPASTPTDPTLELHWTFDDFSGSTVLDISGNNRHGALQGGAGLVDTSEGKAVSLDGIDDFISFNGPRDPALYGGADGAFTISTRARLADVAALNTFCNGCGPVNAVFFGNLSGGNRVMGKLLDDSTNGFTYPTSTSFLTNDTWVEVTMTVDGATGTKFYVDCALDSEIANAAVGLKDYGYSAIGRGSAANNWFRGEIAELRIWNKQLSDVEVAALCQ